MDGHHPPRRAAQLQLNLSRFALGQRFLNHLMNRPIANRLQKGTPHRVGRGKLQQCPRRVVGEQHDAAIVDCHNPFAHRAQHDRQPIAVSP
jgi:hypothetical protein